MSVTAVSLKAKLPEFENESDPAVEFAIEEANRFVDADTWLADDVDLALTYLAAHHLAVSIYLRESGNGSRVKSETLGRFSFTYDYASQQVPTRSDLSSTDYGQRYLELAGLNFPPVAIV